MENNILIEQYAKVYNIKEFIQSDPIQFPHRYTNKKDVEISAFISAWIAYGNRKAILKTLEILHQEYKTAPYEFIKNREFNKYKDNNNSLYRFYKYSDYFNLCEKLYQIYVIEGFESLEDKIFSEINKNFSEKNGTFSEKNNYFPEKKTYNLDIIQAIVDIFLDVEGIPINTKSACKRLCMLCRWLVRNDGIVDLGIWNKCEPKDLIIPVDTHVYRIALDLGITSRKQADMQTAIEITDYLKTIFPNDPSIGDFALFGFGVNNK